MRAILAALSLLILAIPAQADPWGKVTDQYPVSQGSSWGSLASRARSYMGETAHQLGLPGRLWCADFINKITGGGTGSRQAKSYLHYGTKARYGCTDCIAVLSRGRRGGHVGIVTGYDAKGNPIIVSGNHGHRVGEGVYSKHRVLGYRNAA